MAKGKYLKERPESYLTGNRIVVKRPPGRKPKSAANEMHCPQAQNIIEKFGGARELARVLAEVCPDPKDHYNPSTIYRWTYPRSVGGSGGEIPAYALKTIVRVARIAGVLLTSADLYPHLFEPPSPP